MRKWMKDITKKLEGRTRPAKTVTAAAVDDTGTHAREGIVAFALRWHPWTLNL